MTRDMDDSIDWTATANSMTGGQYKKIIDKKFLGWCKTVWDPRAEKAYANLRLHSNFPEFGKHLHFVLIEEI